MSEEDKTRGADIGQFDEDTKLRNNANKKIFIMGISAFVVIVVVIAVYFFTQQQGDSNVVVAGYKDVLESNLPKPKNNAKYKNKSVSVKINPLVNPMVKQNGQSKFEEEIKKTLEKVLTLHKNSKNEADKLTKNNQESLKRFEKSIIRSQNTNNYKVFSEINKYQKTIFSKISSLFDNKKQKIEKLEIINAAFELVGINLWDSKPQATIRYQGKTSIVDIGSVRIGWKIIDIDFDKEQITILKNGQETTLEKIK